MPGPVPQGGAPTQGQPSPGVGAPFLGLFLDRPAHLIPASGFSACNNVKIYLNTVTNWQCGWLTYQDNTNYPPASAITGGGIFQLSTAGYQILIVANTTDIYAYAGSSPPSGYFDHSFGPDFITPVYITGTVDNDGAGNLTGHGTAWNTAIGTGFRKNMRPGDYIYLNNPGSTTINAPSDAHWHKIATVVSDTSATIVDAGPVIAGQTYTLRQCLQANSENHRVSCETFPNAGAPDNQDLFFLTDFGGTQRFTSTDPIVIYDPTKRFATYFSTAAFVCGVFRRFNNVLIYGRLSTPGGSSTTDLIQTEIASSDNGLPKALSGGVTFQGTVSDGPEPILHLGVMGNTLLIYTGSNAGTSNTNTSSTLNSNGSIISAQFVGLPTVWQFQTVVRNRSPITGEMVQEFTDRHQFITTEGEYRYNGMFLQVMNDHIWRGVMQNIDGQNVKLSFSAQLPSLGEIIWYVPVVTPLTSPITLVGYCEHYLEMANSYLFKPYSQRSGTDPGGTFDLTCFLGMNTTHDLSVTGSRGGGLFGAADGGIRLFGAGTINTPQFDAQAMVSSVTFASRVVAGERSRGLVKRIYPFLETFSIGAGSTGPVQSASAFSLTVKLQMQDRIGGATTLTDTQTIAPLGLDSGTANRFTTHYRRGRVAKITFSTTGHITAGNAVGDCTFVLDGYDWDLPAGSKGGQR
jgi:hypothetical protein